MTDYSKLSDRELDARAGLLAGTVIITAAYGHVDHDKPFRIVSITLRDGYNGIQPDRPNVEHGYLIPDNIPHFSTDLNAARELEQEIERRGMHAANPWWDYAQALMNICRPDGDWHALSQERIAWIAATATARQRAEAFCAAMDSCPK